MIVKKLCELCALCVRPNTLKGYITQFKACPGNGISTPTYIENLRRMYVAIAVCARIIIGIPYLNFLWSVL